MATMVKEKRKEKKKSKEKHASTSKITADQPLLVSKDEDKVLVESALKTVEKPIEKLSQDDVSVPVVSGEKTSSDSPKESTQIETLNLVSAEESKSEMKDLVETAYESHLEFSTPTQENIKDNNEIDLKESIDQKPVENNEIVNVCTQLNESLGTMEIPSLNTTINSEADISFENVDSKTIAIEIEIENLCENIEIVPSAPIFDEEPEVSYQGHIAKQVVTPKVKALSIEEATKLYGGQEIAEVKAMSERESAIVEAGPTSGPEHPLVDLLSTFRSSLKSMERERAQLAINIAEEENFRNKLWKIEKLSKYVSQKCACGSNVEFRAYYETAEFYKEKLPVAKMKLEGILRDVQESFCHHLHAALLAHCQIEELVSDTTQSSKSEIREALALILEALRLSDSAPEALSKALQRWAAELSAALLDGRDLRQMIHLIHHLFRQTRSVWWATRVFRHSVTDKVSASQTIAILELLLVRTRVESAKECTEVSEEWEEIDKHGSSGGVSFGELRERELVALLRRLAPKQLVARLLNFTRTDITQTKPAEWLDPSNGSSVFRACCGVRVLIGTLHRATLAHVTYKRLKQELVDIGVVALKGLAALHLHNRDTYSPELMPKLTSELEAAFSEGFNLLKPDNLHRLPASLLSASVARDYCVVLMVGLHEKSPKLLDALSIEIPVLPCEVRIKMATQAAADRSYDHELARMVLDFLIQTHIKRKPVGCAGACDVTARECISQVIEAHSYLHTLAFQILADFTQGEAVDAQTIKPLSVDTWRPSPGEVNAVLDHWSHRCPQLIQHLLLHLDYTPHSGIELQTQLSIGWWLCAYNQSPTQEWMWTVLRRMRLHPTLWKLGEREANSVEERQPNGIFEMAVCLLGTPWGSCVPLICSQGIKALCAVARVRVREAIHCLAPIMLVMAQSPQSISLTPGFQELFTILLSSGPSLIQRAFGSETVTGSDMILRLMLTQLDRNRDMGVSKPALISAWLHALWWPSSPALPLLDVAMLVNKMWSHLDAHISVLLQQENAKETLNHTIKYSYQAPVLCESVLRLWHANRELRLWAPLLRTLHLQRMASQKIHVDNALKAIGASITSEDLIIHKAVTAAMTVPLQHPHHLVIWRLFMHLYLQRPPEHLHESTPPVGPLFFNGLIKSRVMTQIRKRLNDTATYHKTEAENLKTKLEESQLSPSKTNIETSRINDDLLPEITIRDLTGESSESEDSDSEVESEISEDNGDREDNRSENMRNMYTYHVAAEKMTREYLRWLDEGDKVLAQPYQADIARFIPEYALEEAWNTELARLTPSVGSPAEFPLPEPVNPVERRVIYTPLDVAVRAVMGVKDTSSKRVRKPNIKSPVENVDFKDMRSLLNLVEKHLADIERLSKEWASEICRLSSLDVKLWELVSGLRVRRPLPPVKKSCANKCRPVTIVVPYHEWCRSLSTEQAIADNRSSARATIRRLARPRPHSAKTAAALLTIARRIMYCEAAVRVSERAFCSASGSRGPLPEHALTAVISYLAEKWICHDGKLVSELLSRWCRNPLTDLQQTLVGNLISPRRMSLKDWRKVYCSLLQLNLPSHTVFSYFSKFEMSRWSESVDAGQRQEVLTAILEAVQRWGPNPSEEHHILIELLGVHTCQIVHHGSQLQHISACNVLLAAGRLPVHYCTPFAQTNVSGDLDQLVHLLRSLAAPWWAARTSHSHSHSPLYTQYAPLVATLLRTMMRGLVTAGLELSYTPERVVVYAWSALIESWSPWIVPHNSIPPLLSDDVMLTCFVDCWRQLAIDAPGTEPYLLQQSFDYVIQTYLSVKSGECHPECDSQLSALLSHFSQLPWRECQWFCDGALRIGVQACSQPFPQLHSWLCATCASVSRDSWRRAAGDSGSVAAALYFLTVVPHDAQALEEATHIEWSLLRPQDLDEALDRFFQQYHNPAVPYHELPQFRLILAACNMLPTLVPTRGENYSPRPPFISRWTRAASDPALSSHVRSYCEDQLKAIGGVAPYITEAELEELLSRAVIIMCLQTAAAPALVVWQQWVSKSDRRLVTASLSAAAVLTSFEHFAALSDTAAKSYLKLEDTTGWEVISTALSRSAWNSAALVSRGKLTAAYARALSEPIEDVKHIVNTLFAEQLNFVEDEIIISVWICALCRIASRCEDVTPSTLHAAVKGVGGWGEERGLFTSLIRGSAAPTDKHRLLCRLALCVLSPSDQSVKAYETTCVALGLNDVTTWGKSADLRKMPQLAIRLYPDAEKYFEQEMNLTSQ